MRRGGGGVFRVERPQLRQESRAVVARDGAGQRPGEARFPHLGQGSLGKRGEGLERIAPGHAVAARRSCAAARSAIRSFDTREAAAW
jgi:hypothetical protein